MEVHDAAPEALHPEELEPGAEPAGAEPHVSLVDWLEAEPDELRARYPRLYVPRHDGRYLQRNARVALENLALDAEP